MGQIKSNRKEKLWKKLN